MCPFDVYYDSLTEALWFASLHPELDIDRNNYQIINRRGRNPELIELITQYDKPDIILVEGERPLLVIEKTQEVPTGHNVGQRFARLVRAIELGIPTIYYFPFDAKKHGEYAGICNLNIRLIKAASKMHEIHRTPLLCVNWLTDGHGEIVTDGSENNGMIELIESYFSSNYNHTCAGMRQQIEVMNNEYNRRLAIYPEYGNMPPSVTAERTSDFLEAAGIVDAPPTIRHRQSTYVYKIAMTPEKCKRQDPYTGTAFIYDYINCRNGPSASNKHSNLVLHFPNITLDTWMANNPNNPNAKSSNWYLTANILLLQDGHIVIRE